MEEWDLLNLDKDFEKYFPNLEFELKDFQKIVISNIVEKGNTLCIMPTGGGKSVIYWMSTLETEGTAIVISPLTALISEQSEKIEEHGYETLVFHGGISASKQIELLRKFANKEYNPRFIFASPEKIATDGFFEYCIKLRKEDIKLIVIDEVHCVSQWGMSFRPFYQRIPDFLDSVYGENNWSKILALTATLNPKELGDICSSFKIPVDNIIKDTMLMRSEIQLHTHKFIKEDDKEEFFWELLERHESEKILVYLYRKKGDRGVEGLCQKALDKGYKAELFHGDMIAKDRMNIIERYRNGEVNIIFATNAFGMGIDIPNIRVVIHFMIPESAEQYYQEIGRAARDGNGANAYLLYSNKNIDVKRTYFIDQSFPSHDKLMETHKKLVKKVGYKTLPYFEDEDIQECLPYYIESGLVKIEGKGFSDIKDIYDIKDKEIENLFNSTKGKRYIRTVIENDLTPRQFSDKIYGALKSENIKIKKPLERWLVINALFENISDTQMEKMLTSIGEKKKYKHELLDYFVYLIEENKDSQHLHQEIARYLGMDKYQLKRIYKTLDGNMVRSKSEVIICNLLYNNGIKYIYEKNITCPDGSTMNPDFTIQLNNNDVLYWEHVGMLGKEEYDNAWIHKLRLYKKYYPDKLLKTYETGSLSKDAEIIIEKIKAIGHK